jgi:hypothetical protein
MFSSKQTEYASSWQKIEKAAKKSMEKAMEQFAQIP